MYPCEQGDNIKDIRLSLHDMAINTQKLCESNSLLIAEMRDITKQITAHMVENGELKIRMMHVEAEIKAVADLRDWQNKMKGYLIVFPAGCALISSVAAIVAILGKVG